MEQNQGPGGSNTKSAGGTKEAGTPRAAQGARPPAGVRQNQNVPAGV